MEASADGFAFLLVRDRGDVRDSINSLRQNPSPRRGLDDSLYHLESPETCAFRGIVSRDFSAS
jgi:hypothetical protein